jgi:hypothetical protein
MCDGVGVHADDPRTSTATREFAEAGGVSKSCGAARTLSTWHVKGARHAFTSPRHLRLHVTAGPSSTHELTRPARPRCPPTLPSAAISFSLAPHFSFLSPHIFLFRTRVRTNIVFRSFFPLSFSPTRNQANPPCQSLHPPPTNTSGEPGHDGAFDCVRQHSEGVARYLLRTAVTV